METVDISKHPKEMRKIASEYPPTPHGARICAKQQDGYICGRPYGHDDGGRHFAYITPQHVCFMWREA